MHRARRVRAISPGRWQNLCNSLCCLHGNVLPDRLLCKRQAAQHNAPSPQQQLFSVSIMSAICRPPAVQLAMQSMAINNVRLGCSLNYIGCIRQGATPDDPV